MTAFSTTDLFYELDERRRGSVEVDFGVWWKWQRESFRVSWLASTGEVVAVRLGHGPRLRALNGRPPIRIATHAEALEVLSDPSIEVTVLGRCADRESVERQLKGWEFVMEIPESLAWVSARLRYG